MAAPGWRAIFLMLSRTSLDRPALLSTAIAVSRSVKASTPLRRWMLNSSTGEFAFSSWMTVRVTSGRSWSIAPSMDAMSVAVTRRAEIFACSMSRSFSRWIAQSVEPPKPTIRTTTIRTAILAARRERKTAGDSIAGRIVSRYDLGPMNLARLGEENVRTFGEYVSLAFEGREWTNVEQQ